jgi:hypothetical protein
MLSAADAASSAIIFLAPVSCFDQSLEEDHRVNRLVCLSPLPTGSSAYYSRVAQEDSVLLWKAIVSNRPLANTNLVLFLNKCDILQHKLAAGVRFAAHVVSYGDRPNEFASVSKCAWRRRRVKKRWLIEMAGQT